MGIALFGKFVYGGGAKEGMHMTDQEFLDTFITERMQMHYSSKCPRLTADELATALQLESEYNRALETLPPKVATAIKKFHESVSDKLTEDGTFCRFS